MVRLAPIRLHLLAVESQCFTLRLMLISAISDFMGHASDSTDFTREDCCLLLSNCSHERSRLTLLDKRHFTTHVALRVGSVRHINSHRRSKSAMNGGIDILLLLSTTSHTSPSGFLSYSMSLRPFSLSLLELSHIRAKVRALAMLNPATIHPLL